MAISANTPPSPKVSSELALKITPVSTQKPTITIDGKEFFVTVKIDGKEVASEQSSQVANLVNRTIPDIIKDFNEPTQKKTENTPFTFHFKNRQFEHLEIKTAATETLRADAIFKNAENSVKRLNTLAGDISAASTPSSSIADSSPRQSPDITPPRSPTIASKPSYGEGNEFDKAIRELIDLRGSESEIPVSNPILFEPSTPITSTRLEVEDFLSQQLRIAQALKYALDANVNKRDLLWFLSQLDKKYQEFLEQLVWISYCDDLEDFNPLAIQVDIENDPAKSLLQTVTERATGRQITVIDALIGHIHNELPHTREVEAEIEAQLANGQNYPQWVAC